MLNCRCGAVMISDGKQWRCALAGQPISLDANHTGDTVTDLRILRPGPLVTKPEGPVGAPHSKRRARLKDKLHGGTLRTCFSCNPSTAEHFRKLEARFAAMRAR
jgi:hypothetical protein